MELRYPQDPLRFSALYLPGFSLTTIGKKNYEGRENEILYLILILRLSRCIIGQDDKVPSFEYHWSSGLELKKNDD